MVVIKLIVLSFFIMTSLQAFTIKESVDEVISSHPVVMTGLRNYRATKQEVSIADAGYMPRLDLTSAIGHKEVGHLADSVPRNGFDVYENSLVLTQNVFNGWGTLYQVNYEKARTVAAAYDYVEKANDIAFQMVDAYLTVLKTDALYQLAKEQVSNNELIYEKVYDLHVAGLAARSEVDKIQSSLSLARSNVTVKRNNLLDAEAKFRRILGREPDFNALVLPELNVPMPESEIRALNFAIKHNPSILISDFNLKAAQALYSQRRNNYYPKLDIELSQHYNDNLDNFTGKDDRFQAMLVLTYNLYRGGADSAEIQKNVSNINKEVEIRREHKRQVIESLELSWAAYRMLAIQLDDLYKFQSFSHSTLKLYEDEYALGQRSLLDLLAAQNDFFNAKHQITQANFDYLYSKYRILDAMGVLVLAVEGKEYDYVSKVGLVDNRDGNESIEDEIPVRLDADNDHILDNVDLCNNSEENATVMPYGCRKIIGDEDDDGVLDNIDECPHTPLSLNVDYQGCPVNFNLNIEFEKLSANINPKSFVEIEQFARFMEEHYNYNALIIGHTDNVGTTQENMKLSKLRAKAVKDVVVSYGVDEVRLHATGRGESEPIADNSVEEGKAKNRRTEIELSSVYKIKKVVR